MATPGLGSLSLEASSLFRVHRTVCRMLEGRGYILPDTLLSMDANEFKDRYGDSPERQALTILTSKVSDNTDQILVIFAETQDGGKLGVKPIKDYIQKMKEENVRRAIIIVKLDITPIAKQALREIAQRGYRIEHFRDTELLVDLPAHRHIPQHTVLTPQETKELLERYRLKLSQLPRIRVTDPMARYLGLSPKQVVKITRTSETAGRYISYRCVG